MFYFQLTFLVLNLSHFIREGVRTEMKGLLNVSNADILFVDTFLQLICANFSITPSCLKTKNNKFLRQKTDYRFITNTEPLRLLSFWSEETHILLYQ